MNKIKTGAGALLTFLLMLVGSIMLAGPASAHHGDLTQTVVCDDTTGEYVITNTQFWSNVPTGVTGTGTSTSGPKFTTTGSSGSFTWQHRIPGTSTSSPWEYVHIKFRNGHEVDSQRRIDSLAGNCKVAIPEQPAPYTEYGEWGDWTVDCDAGYAERGRWSWTVDWEWDGSEWQPVLGPEVADMEYRDLSPEEDAACNPIPPQPEPEQKVKDTLVCKDGMWVHDQYTAEYVLQDGVWVQGPWVWVGKTKTPATAEECGYTPEPRYKDTIRCQDNQLVRDLYMTTYAWDPSTKSWVGTEVWDSKEFLPLTEDQVADCLGAQPDPKVDEGEWEGGQPTCDDPKAEQTRTVTTTVYVPIYTPKVGWDWVLDTENSVTTTESRTAVHEGDCATPPTEEPPVTEPPVEEPPVEEPPTVAPPTEEPPAEEPPAVTPPVSVQQQCTPLYADGTVSGEYIYDADACTWVDAPQERLASTGMDDASTGAIALALLMGLSGAALLVIRRRLVRG